MYMLKSTQYTEMYSIRAMYLNVVFNYRNNALSPEQKFLLTLRYYATGSLLAVCKDFVGVRKSKAIKIILLVSRELAKLRSKCIRFPSTSEEIEKVSEKFFDISMFPRCIGAIDCTHVRIKSPGRLDGEIYRNRKGYFSINVQTVCNADFRFQNIVCTSPGSTHDNTIFNNSKIRDRFEKDEMRDNFIVGDNAYALKKYLMTPFEIPIDDGQNKYNRALMLSRNAVKSSCELWKMRFPVLVVGINMKLPYVRSIIVATAVLHNTASFLAEKMPRMPVLFKEEISLTTFNPIVAVNDPLNDPLNDGTLQRNNLVRYFETL